MSDATPPSGGAASPAWADTDPEDGLDAATGDDPGGAGARGGFVGAFVRTVRRDQGGRAGTRVAAGVLVVVLALAAVVAGGALLSRTRSHPKNVAVSRKTSAGATPGGRTSPPGVTPTYGSGGGGVAPPSAGASAGARAGAGAPASSKAAPYVSVSAPGCTAGGASYQEHGRYSDGSNGWWTVGSGGWTGNGCPGSFTDVPMSGETQKDDPTAYVVWGFHVPSGTQRCTVSMYVPSSGRPRDVASSRAHYRVLSGTGADSPTIDQADLDQKNHQGSWQGVGTYDVRGGVIGIELVNRGIDFTDSAKTYAHLAASAGQVSCVPA